MRAPTRAQRVDVKSSIIRASDEMGTEDTATDITSFIATRLLRTNFVLPNYGLPSSISSVWKFCQRPKGVPFATTHRRLDSSRLSEVAHPFSNDIVRDTC